jgi:hypothetical protein|uniref:DUF7633 domain-containing protein n=1 Tax=Pseudo-nitzschia australis TaxID=44445 RepID=A0A7S4EFT8_9STRA|mmetsp:Transcript_8929/g.19290  ORF Transcript_8929/g.19290 Transcript_8929/m.19290 type:complete len:506 (+) Transcript_8929:53-1570(+)
MMFSPSISTTILAAAGAAVFYTDVHCVNAGSLFSEYYMKGGVLSSSAQSSKLSWSSSVRWIDHKSFPSLNDTVWIQNGKGEDGSGGSTDVYISIDDVDAAVNTMVLSTSETGYSHVQMDVLQDKKLTVYKDFVVGDGGESTLAVVYVGKSATVSVGGNLVVGSNVASTATIQTSSSSSGSGNGALILSGNASALKVGGVLNIGGSTGTANCGLGTIDMSWAATTTISANDLQICNDQSRLIMAKGNTLQLQTDRRDQIQQMISQELIVVSSNGQGKNEISVKYLDGITTLSVVDSTSDGVGDQPAVGCPGDVELSEQLGSSVTATSDPILDAVQIVQQNKTSVTVNLKQLWSSGSTTIDSIYYAFRAASDGSLKGWSGDLKCYQETSVPFSSAESIDTIDIACNVLHPIATLEVCLVDSTDHGILHPLTTTDIPSIIPKCCHRDPALATGQKQSGVCYNLDINCAPPTAERCAQKTTEQSEEEMQRRRATIASRHLRKRTNAIVV